MDADLAVYALDRRGSGSSRGVRGDVSRYGNWLDEVAAVVAQARADYPDRPGASGGTLLRRERRAGERAAAGARRSVHRDADAGAVRPAGLHGLGEDAHRSDRLCWRPTRAFRVPQDDDLFTRDPAVLAWIQQDALGARTVTARCLWQVNAMLRALRSNVGQVRLPVLVCEAAHDRLSDNTRNRALLTRALGDRCRWQTFDAEHFLLAEPCRAQVIDTLVRWATEEAGA